MRASHLVAICAFVLVSGDAFDSATTAIALVSPQFAGQFVEATNPIIRLFMYNLGLASSTGFFVGIALSWGLDVLMIYGAYLSTRSYTGTGLGAILVLMTLLGLGHYVAGFGNLQLLQSADLTSSILNSKHESAVA